MRRMIVNNNSLEEKFPGISRVLLYITYFSLSNHSCTAAEIATHFRWDTNKVSKMLRFLTENRYIRCTFEGENIVYFMSSMDHDLVFNLDFRQRLNIINALDQAMPGISAIRLQSELFTLETLIRSYSKVIRNYDDIMKIIAYARMANVKISSLKLEDITMAISNVNPDTKRKDVTAEIASATNRLYDFYLKSSTVGDKLPNLLAISTLLDEWGLDFDQEERETILDTLLKMPYFQCYTGSKE